MPYNPQHHHRHAMRLPGYDYTQAGAYFVTIVTHQRELLFDDPVLRRAVETLWLDIPKHFPTVALDENVLMSNHLHGVLWIIGEGRGEAHQSPQPSGVGFATDTHLIGNPATFGTPVNPDSMANASPLRMPPGSLSAVIGNFKSVTTRRINQIRRSPGGVVWQRSFHDRIIRNERELAAIRQYIRDNPANWARDHENPQL
jgi:putative transposase